MDQEEFAEQQENLDRVRSRIRAAIENFFVHCIETGQRIFHADDLRRAVAHEIGGFVAPGSPDRVMRDLRQKGIIGYRVLSRSESLYEVLWIRNQQKNGNGEEPKREGEDADRQPRQAPPEAPPSSAPQQPQRRPPPTLPGASIAGE